ncbi:hypothetical protein AB4Z38_16945 [Arthrobacter sp. 2RAF6]|uniref:hypothetical protein n=1 Tax=Arthrobacter sp. 2RAF6 TaxID=3233002 RepID=UPI003F92D588
MNDREERELADKYLLAAFASERERKKIRLPYGLGANGIWAEQEPRRFLLSASREGDALTMWRGYAGIETQSYAIGLNASKALRILHPNAAHPKVWPDDVDERGWTIEPKVSRWFPVVYSQAASSQLATTAVRYLHWLGNNGESDAGEVFDGALDVTEEMRDRIKHHGFEDEREVRIMAVANLPLLRLRPGRGGKVPYIVLTGAAKTVDSPVVPEPHVLPIEKIRISPLPAGDRAHAKQSLEVQLASCGYHGVEVLVSEIPFRV